MSTIRTSHEGAIHILDRRRAERRRRRHVWLGPERRSGFDRRRARSSAIGSFFNDTIDQMHRDPFAVAVVLLALNCLNLLDALLTVDALALGAREVNPLMNALFQSGTAQAIAFKVALVAAFSSILWAMRGFRLGLVAAFAASCTYVIVAAYHVTLLIVF